MHQYCTFVLYTFKKVALETKYPCIDCELTLTQYFMERGSSNILLTLYWQVLAIWNLLILCSKNNNRKTNVLLWITKIVIMYYYIIIIIIIFLLSQTQLTFFNLNILHQRTYKLQSLYIYIYHYIYIYSHYIYI